MTEMFFRVTRSYWTGGLRKRINRPVRNRDLRLIATWCAAGQIAPTMDVVSPVFRVTTCRTPARQACPGQQGVTERYAAATSGLPLTLIRVAERYASNAA